MKAEIHPDYHKDAKITCACGNVMTVGSTMADISIELCSKCHPFYTGKQNLVDTAGRVEKFKNRIVAKDSLTDRVGKRVKKEREVAKKQEKAAAEA